MRNFQQIDHVLYGGPDLDQGIGHLHQLSGTKPVTGGSHPGKGTRNALLGLSDGAYLEIIAPDPQQQVTRVWMDLNKTGEASLFRWAAKCHDLPALRAKAIKAGIDIGEIQQGSRRQTDGSLLKWQLSDPNVVLCDGLVPFFIDWGEGGNPTSQLPKTGNIKSFYATHPRPDKVLTMLHALDIEMDVHKGDKPALHIEIDGNNRSFHLK